MQFVGRPQGAPMGWRLAPIDIEHPKTLSQFRADQCLTRQTLPSGTDPFGFFPFAESEMLKIMDELK